MSGMTREEIVSWLNEHFPGSTDVLSILHVDASSAGIRLEVRPHMLRPGGTVSGPTMMMLADTAAYTAILGNDAQCRTAVTSNLNISFLRRPQAQQLEAHAEILKFGRRLIVAEVRITAKPGKPVALATVTYVRS